MSKNATIKHRTMATRLLLRRFKVPARFPLIPVIVGSDIFIPFLAHGQKSRRRDETGGRLPTYRTGKSALIFYIQGKPFFGSVTCFCCTPFARTGCSYFGRCEGIYTQAKDMVAPTMETKYLYFLFIANTTPSNIFS